MDKAPFFPPTEHQEQVSLIQWCALHAYKYPELDYIFAIPNGGQRHPAVAVKLKAEGVKPGVPDLMLPVARQGYHGLFLEMKRIGGKLSPAQIKWRDALDGYDYKVVTCEGWLEAVREIEDYLR